MALLPRIPFYSRYTLRLHLPAAACEGAVFAMVNGLGDVVMAKGLHASPGYITALAVAFPSSLLLATLWSGLMVGRSKRPFFLGAGILGRLPLLLMPLVTGPVGFLALIVPAAMSYSVILPAQNTVFQANYPAAIRGRIFAATQMLSAVTGIVTALGLGWVLERWEGAFRIVYPLAGLLGLYACWLMARIKVRGQRRRWGVRGRPPLQWREAVAEAIASTRASMKILKTDRAFRRFELGFSLYGIGFMTMQPIIPVFLVAHLHASYLEAAIAKQGIFGLVQLACLPLSGRVVDRVGPVRAGSRFFLLLAAFPLALSLATGMPSAYLAFALMGAAMAGVGVLWNLASIHFAHDRDSAPYQGVHIALVGFRGLFAPLFGYAALTIGVPRLGMVFAAGFLVAAAVVLHRLDGRLRRGEMTIGEELGPTPAEPAAEPAVRVAAGPS